MAFDFRKHQLVCDSLDHEQLQYLHKVKFGVDFGSSILTVGEKLVTPSAERKPVPHFEPCMLPLVRIVKDVSSGLALCSRSGFTWEEEDCLEEVAVQRTPNE